VLSVHRCVGNSPRNLLVQRSRISRLWHSSRYWGMGPEKKLEDIFNMTKPGRLWHILAVVDRLPDKLRPWRFKDVTLRLVEQPTPFQLQGVKSKEFQPWRLLSGSMTDFVNSKRKAPSWFNDITNTKWK